MLTYFWLVGLLTFLVGGLYYWRADPAALLKVTGLEIIGLILITLAKYHAWFPCSDSLR